MKRPSCETCVYVETYKKSDRTLYACQRHAPSYEDGGDSIWVRSDYFCGEHNDMGLYLSWDRRCKYRCVGCGFVNDIRDYIRGEEISCCQCCGKEFDEISKEEMGEIRNSIRIAIGVDNGVE